MSTPQSDADREREEARRRQQEHLAEYQRIYQEQGYAAAQAYEQAATTGYRYGMDAGQSIEYGRQRAAEESEAATKARQQEHLQNYQAIQAQYGHAAARQYELAASGSDYYREFQVPASQRAAFGRQMAGVPEPRQPEPEYDPETATLIQEGYDPKDAFILAEGRRAKAQLESEGKEFAGQSITITGDEATVYTKSYDVPQPKSPETIEAETADVIKSLGIRGKALQKDFGFAISRDKEGNIVEVQETLISKPAVVSKDADLKQVYSDLKGEMSKAAVPDGAESGPVHYTVELEDRLSGGPFHYQVNLGAEPKPHEFRPNIAEQMFRSAVGLGGGIFAGTVEGLAWLVGKDAPINRRVAEGLELAGQEARGASSLNTLAAFYAALGKGTGLRQYEFAAISARRQAEVEVPIVDPLGAGASGVLALAGVESGREGVNIFLEQTRTRPLETITTTAIDYLLLGAPGLLRGRSPQVRSYHDYEPKYGSTDRLPTDEIFLSRQGDTFKLLSQEGRGLRFGPYDPTRGPGTAANVRRFTPQSRVTPQTPFGASAGAASAARREQTTVTVQEPKVELSRRAAEPPKAQTLVQQAATKKAESTPGIGGMTGMRQSTQLEEELEVQVFAVPKEKPGPSMQRQDAIMKELATGSTVSRKSMLAELRKAGKGMTGSELARTLGERQKSLMKLQQVAKGKTMQGYQFRLAAATAQKTSQKQASELVSQSKVAKELSMKMPRPRATPKRSTRIVPFKPPVPRSKPQKIKVKSNIGITEIKKLGVRNILAPEKLGLNIKGEGEKPRKSGKKRKKGVFDF